MGQKRSSRRRGDEDDEVINIDADPWNADWIKALHWDLPTEPDVFIGSVLYLDPERSSAEDARRAWEHFKTLPAFRPMPPELRDKVEEIIAGWGKR
jgi:hypothetical protein